jgi:hypothetical protein
MIREKAIKMIGCDAPGCVAVARYADGSIIKSESVDLAIEAAIHNGWKRTHATSYRALCPRCQRKGAR